MEEAFICGIYPLTKITIPSSITEIGIYDFEGCSSLTQIAIPSSAAEKSPPLFQIKANFIIQLFLNELIEI